jgi:hypothetical protein
MPAEVRDMTEFKPFADGTASLEVGGLTIENGGERIAVYGSLDIGRDAAGLDAARRLRDVLDAAVRSLEAAPLGERAVAEAPVRVGNPFG